MVSAFRHDTIEPQIGCWWAECCMEDLRQVTTEVELERLKEIIQDHEDDGIPLYVFRTHEEAVQALDEAVPLSAHGSITDLLPSTPRSALDSDSTPVRQAH